MSVISLHSSYSKTRCCSTPISPRPSMDLATSSGQMFYRGTIEIPIDTKEILKHIHKDEPISLPTDECTSEQVRWFIYKVLTLKTYNIAKDYPGFLYVTCTGWQGTGRDFRLLTEHDIRELCPYSLEFEGRPKQSALVKCRTLIGRAIWEHVSRLRAKEAADLKRVQKEKAKEEELEQEKQKWQILTRGGMFIQKSYQQLRGSRSSTPQPPQIPCTGGMSHPSYSSLELSTWYPVQSDRCSVRSVGPIMQPCQTVPEEDYYHDGGTSTPMLRSSMHSYSAPFYAQHQSPTHAITHLGPQPVGRVTLESQFGAPTELGMYPASQHAVFPQSTPGPMVEGGRDGYLAKPPTNPPDLRAQQMQYPISAPVFQPVRYRRASSITSQHSSSSDNLRRQVRFNNLRQRYSTMSSSCASEISSVSPLTPSKSILKQPATTQTPPRPIYGHHHNSHSHDAPQSSVIDSCERHTHNCASQHRWQGPISPEMFPNLNDPNRFHTMMTEKMKAEKRIAEKMMAETIKTDKIVPGGASGRSVSPRIYRTPSTSSQSMHVYPNNARHDPQHYAWSPQALPMSRSSSKVSSCSISSVTDSTRCETPVTYYARGSTPSIAETVSTLSYKSHSHALNRPLSGYGKQKMSALEKPEVVFVDPGAYMYGQGYLVDQIPERKKGAGLLDCEPTSPC
ncbi:hypothetical protein K432DRAFT_451684 [Lepidopterella palustris CBS 459.81]|uniref:Uncharacterized protein n=1 Tax=Lepidopterella palustris CBS 459.81 TaxID=1314670 RepID=A0A8E2JFM8_9PEZI|nr:hypothetical protein K432DRAFT_451684 [Lepidopterella palustris CBS 459.81]